MELKNTLRQKGVFNVFFSAKVNSENQYNSIDEV